MPVVWNAETEAKLLAGIFQVCDIKVTTAQKAELAKMIGPECTPKAITHRIDKFKKASAGFTPKGTTPSSTPKKAKDADLLKGIAEGEKGHKRKQAERAAAEAEADAEDEEDLPVEEEKTLAKEKSPAKKIKVEEGAGEVGAGAVEGSSTNESF